MVKGDCCEMVDDGRSTIGEISNREYGDHSRKVGLAKEVGEYLTKDAQNQHSMPWDAAGLSTHAHP
jgi:hypothetical protein